MDNLNIFNGRRRYGTGTTLLIVLGIIAVIWVIYSYVEQRSGGPMGISGMSSDMNPAYSDSSMDSSEPHPDMPSANVDSYASADGVQSSIIQPNVQVRQQESIQNPAELLPKSNDSPWSAVAPNGQGELANINLLKAGFLAGIDTVGTSLRNANQQIRSEPPNPQIYQGPWNISTITHDSARLPPSFEIGQGPM